MIEKRFYVAKSGEIAYLNIAKSGCTSIKVALSNIRKSSSVQGNFNVHNPMDYELLFLDILSPGNRLLENIFKFTFVRHPVERVLSFYRNKILVFDENVTPYYQERGVKYGCDIESFIRALTRIDPSDLEEHLYPQAYTVFDGGKIIVDWVGSLEHIGSHWPDLMRLIGHSAEIRSVNETQKDTRSQLSNEALALLKDYYRLDGYCFGYYQQGPLDDQMRNLRALFEEHRSEAVTNEWHRGINDWQQVNRAYLENIHSQLAHLRRQIRGVNQRLDELSWLPAHQKRRQDQNNHPARHPLGGNGWGMVSWIMRKP